MKIAFVNDTFLQGRGADMVIYELAKRLGKKHEVLVVCGTSDIKEENFKIKELGFEKLATGTAKDFLGFTKLKKFREACEGYDIINLHHSTLTSSFLGLKNVVVTSHGSPKNTEKKIIRKVFRFLANWFNVFMLNFIPKTIAISKSIKRDIMKRGVFGHKIQIIYDGVSNDFKPTNKDLGYMFFVGRHEQHKRIDEIIRLSKELDFPLKISGQGPLTNKLKGYSKRIGCKKVKFLGLISRKEMIKEYQNCSFFVSASRWEGFGLIFIEAAACSKPSIGYKVFSIPEVIQDKKTGFLANNYPEFKKFAEILIKDKILKKKMGKSALLFSKNFAWDKKAEEYEKLFENINLKKQDICKSTAEQDNVVHEKQEFFGSLARNKAHKGK